MQSISGPGGWRVVWGCVMWVVGASMCLSWYASVCGLGGSRLWVYEWVLWVSMWMRVDEDLRLVWMVEW